MDPTKARQQLVKGAKVIFTDHFNQELKGEIHEKKGSANGAYVYDLVVMSQGQGQIISSASYSEDGELTTFRLLNEGDERRA